MAPQIRLYARPDLEGMENGSVREIEPVAGEGVMPSWRALKHHPASRRFDPVPLALEGVGREWHAPHTRGGVVTEVEEGLPVELVSSGVETSERGGERKSLGA